MTIILRVAHRVKGDTIIQATDEHARFFGIGDMFDVQYLNKQLIITKDPAGTTACHVPTAYQRDGITRMIGKSCLDKWIPGFAVDFAEFEEYGNTLVWTRPPVWQLPWGNKPPRNNRRAHAIKGLSMRLDSCVRNNGKPQFVTQAASNSWCKPSLKPGDWMTLVNNFFPNGSPV